MDRNHKRSCRDSYGLAELEGGVHNCCESAHRRKACAYQSTRHLRDRHKLVKGDVREPSMTKRVAVMFAIALVTVAVSAQQAQSPEQKPPAAKSHAGFDPPPNQAAP